MVCHRCARRLSRDARQCEACGAPVVSAIDPPTARGTGWHVDDWIGNQGGSDANWRGDVDPHRVPIYVLRGLASHPNPMIRKQIAYSRGCPPDLLRQLADDEWVEVLYAVAANPFTPPDALDALASRANPLLDTILLNMITSNPSAPTDHVRMRSKQPQEFSRAQAGRNPNAPLDVLTALAGDKEPGVRSAVGGNPAATPELIARLSRDVDPTVRASIAGNPSAERHLLNDLARDNDGDVARAARRNLENRRKRR